MACVDNLFLRQNLNVAFHIRRSKARALLGRDRKRDAHLLRDIVIFQVRVNLIVIETVGDQQAANVLGRCFHGVLSERLAQIQTAGRD